MQCIAEPRYVRGVIVVFYPCTNTKIARSAVLLRRALAGEAGFGVWSCRAGDAMRMIPGFRTSGLFESFHSGSHQPRLVTEQEAMSSDEDLDFYSTFGRWSYRYIYHYYDSERQTRPEAEIGDEVDLVFWVYLFENRAITASTMPIYTNDRKWAEKLQEQGLDTKYWSFEPRPVRVGGGSFVEGVELSLPGCREKDTVEVYMTYNMAYGDALINFIPEQSPIAVFYTIDSVRK